MKVIFAKTKKKKNKKKKKKKIEYKDRLYYEGELYCKQFVCMDLDVGMGKGWWWGWWWC